MWIFLTFISVFLWSLVNISDHYLTEKNKAIGHPVGALVIFSSVFAIIVSALVYVFLGNSVAISWHSLWIVLIAGVCNLLWIVFYLNALADEEVSYVIPWFLTVPLFGYLFGYLFLGETLTTMQIIGGLIVIIGGLIFSVKKDKDENGETLGTYSVKWKLIGLMVVSSLLIALWITLFKFVAEATSFWQATFWEHIGLFIAGLMVLIFIKSYRDGFMGMLRKGGRQTLAINAFSETATIVGNLIANYAVLAVPVALILVLEVAQPVIVFLLGIVTTLYFPHILKEDISRPTILYKSLCLVIMVIGAILMAY